MVDKKQGVDLIRCINYFRGFISVPGYQYCEFLLITIKNVTCFLTYYIHSYVI